MKNEREVSKSRWLAGQASSQGFGVDKRQKTKAKRERFQAAAVEFVVCLPPKRIAQYQ